jgi:hypothetical protein
VAACPRCVTAPSGVGEASPLDGPATAIGPWVIWRLAAGAAPPGPDNPASDTPAPPEPCACAAPAPALIDSTGLNGMTASGASGGAALSGRISPAPAGGRAGAVPGAGTAVPGPEPPATRGGEGRA